jgi:RNA polymerase sigma-70 factor (ECF subfamily)
LKDNKRDFELIKQALKGNQKAYNELVNLYKHAVFVIIYRMVHNKEEAEDLTQEAFIKAFSSLSSFSEEYPFSTWLFKIATNNCIDYLRKRKLRTYSIDKPIELKHNEVKFELPDKEPDPEHNLIYKERTKLIQQAIDSLPEKYKTCIILRHIKEKSYEEIAKALKLPVGTVKARVFRGREMLNKQLKNILKGY